MGRNFLISVTVFWWNMVIFHRIILYKGYIHDIHSSMGILRDIRMVSRIFKGKDGCSYETNEEIQGHTFMVVLFSFSSSLSVSLLMFILLKNENPGLNITTDYLMVVMLHGKPIANFCSKTYEYMAVTFLGDFKLGHCMKIPPRSRLLIQILKTGFLHADPHPVNLAIDTDESLVYYNFGMMGELKTFTRERLLDLFYAIYEKDAYKGYICICLIHLTPNLLTRKYYMA